MVVVAQVAPAKLSVDLEGEVRHEGEALAAVENVHTASAEAVVADRILYAAAFDKDSARRCVAVASLHPGQEMVGIQARARICLMVLHSMSKEAAGMVMARERPAEVHLEAAMSS